ncbi:MAG: filamentous hemagglutinin family protein [bacterium]
MLKTGHRTRYHLRAFEFLAARRRSRAVLTCTLLASFLATMPTGGLQAGDILRGGASAGNAKRNSEARANAGAAAAEAAKVRAEDRLARTTKAVNDMRALQAAARAAAGANSIPNGLVNGGLKVLTGANAKWEGANAPTAAGSNVNITQTAAQALLHWETFNVGSQTTVNFDQSAGGADSGKWIAFNKVLDPAAKPSEIRGKINAQGQVYIINQNGILFGAGSQVNTRTLVASALPINDNLIKNGLLNNKDAQFLFSGLSVPGGSDGTPDFTPDPLPAGAKYGDVIVERGALLQTPTSADGNGGRIMLVGANVRNEGQISTPAGQTILAAGLQVGIQAHDSGDPSLRGLDVWVGDVGTYAGTITNAGLLESQTGSVLAVGKAINQQGILSSSTSVSLNGRIDLLASYGSAANPEFDKTGLPIFFSQFTGTVNLAKNSITQIAPDLADKKLIPGTSLPEVSAVNLLGLGIYLAPDAYLSATSGKISLKAGIWPYKDQDSDRTVYSAPNKIQADLGSNVQSGVQRFQFTTGQIYVDSGAIVDVSGTAGAFVPIAKNLVDVKLGGNELADSPVQRGTGIRGKQLRVDLRNSGIYSGRQWVGTPLGDLNGIAGLVERDVSQLTAKGGELLLQAGDSIAVQKDAVLDVSGGFYQNEGGLVKTTQLLRGENIVNISKATPNVTYDGILSDEATQSSSKWGIKENFKKPLLPTGAFSESTYREGAPGGSLSLTASALSISGKLLGQTVTGPRQLDTPPVGSTLNLSFTSEERIARSESDIRFIQVSPYHPSIVLSKSSPHEGAPPYTLVNFVPVGLSGSSTAQFTIGQDIYASLDSGFGKLVIYNPDGEFEIPSETEISVPAGGALVVSSSNTRIKGTLTAPGGNISLKAYNFSPFEYQRLKETDTLPLNAAPAVVLGRGDITIASNGILDVSGILVDERITSQVAFDNRRSINGGAISLEGYNVSLSKGSSLLASAGAKAKAKGGFTYGTAGSISLLAGRDPSLKTTIGGTLRLDGHLEAYAVASGGSLTLQSSLVEIANQRSNPEAFLMDPSFFQKGGFTSFTVRGIGKSLADGSNAPAVIVADGTQIEPRAISLARSNSPELAFDPILKPQGERTSTSLSLQGLGADDPLTQDKVEAIGLVVLGTGASIITDPGATVSLSGETVAVLGSIVNHGGKVSISGGGSYKALGSLADKASFALPTTFIGSSSKIDVSGLFLKKFDSFKRNTGTLLDGGSILVTGNIIIQKGAVLDASGSSASVDLNPYSVVRGEEISTIKKNQVALTQTPWGRIGVPTQIDSNGGSIELEGSEMLYNDGLLKGFAGGPTATGGKLSISSGKFYPPDSSRTGADINLIVAQEGDASQFAKHPLAGREMELFLKPPDLEPLFKSGSPNPGIGYFSISQFSSGSFASLDLGYKYYSGGDPIPYGGNVEFRGPISLTANGMVRLAGGGVIKADSTVSVNAPYIAIGQKLATPRLPSDTFYAFQQYPVGGSDKSYYPKPSYGPGSIALSASWIDVGTLSLQNIGKASLAANNGDIRGSGTLSMVGDLTLTAAQIYPTTLADFKIIAYDPTGSKSTIRINGSGTQAPPLSAGGTLSIFASNIFQGGTLRAPLGSIYLGWDGTDFNLTDIGFTQPTDVVGGPSMIIPTAQLVSLENGSSTSVSAIDPLTGLGMQIPYGVSSDGLAWIDPRGMNVTASGLPSKAIRFGGESVLMNTGAQIDLRGGGDLLAYRWNSGIGGTINILGTASGDWTPSASYTAGQLVTYGGKTWSARVSVDGDPDPAKRPSASRYWALVPESYAILPAFSSSVVPAGAFNTSSSANLLTGNPGFISNSLGVGDKIYIGKGSTLAEGSYTLLPKAYALIPGAFLVTPATELTNLNVRTGGTTLEEGSSFVTGYRFNQFNKAQEITAVRSLYEIATPEVIASRASYTVFKASTFMKEAASRLNQDNVQELPIDSGYLAVSANSALRMNSQILTTPFSSGRGSAIDIASFAEINITGGSSLGGTTGVSLNSGILSNWGASSILIGGLRQSSSSVSQVEVRSNSINVSNPGEPLSGPEIILVSKESLSLADGSSILSSGLSQNSLPISLTGDGVALAVSSNPLFTSSRSGLTGSKSPNLFLGAGSTVSGATVLLDSTYATSIDSTSHLRAENLSMISGQVSILLAPQVGALPGSFVAPHLTLSDNLLADAMSSKNLLLASYSVIDIYGSGTMGSDSLQKLTLQAGGDDSTTTDQELSIRGYNQGSGTVSLVANEVVFGNPTSSTGLKHSTSGMAGTFEIASKSLTLDKNNFSIGGYQTTHLEATSGVTFIGTGTFFTAGDLEIATPLLTGSRAAKQSIIAAGQLNIQPTGASSTTPNELGASLTLQGSSVVQNSSIRLPSGLVSIIATNGGASIGGTIDVSGTKQTFYDLTRYTDAGEINVTAKAGSVSFLAGSQVSVASHPLGGNAGRLAISSSGAFQSAGTLSGGSLENFNSGIFLLDTLALTSFQDLSQILDSGGFNLERNLRVRTGDVLVEGISKAKSFSLSADSGSISVAGQIDAHGTTGGKIALSARENITLLPHSVLTVAAEHFDSAGKGGSISLSAGTSKSDGSFSSTALLDIQPDSKMILSVEDYISGSYTDVGSSAFNGQFTGTVQLRAPQKSFGAGLGVSISQIQGDILDASSILVEGYKVFTVTGATGQITGSRSSFSSLPSAGSTQRQVYDNGLQFLGSAGSATAGYTAMRDALLGTGDPKNLSSILVIAPGAEIINTTANGDITLGTSTSNWSLDWNLADFRFGPKSAPGVLTLRAPGNVVFWNTLSDSFTAVTPSAANGYSSMWLSPLAAINNNLPTNTQSWSFRIVAGADLGAANVLQVLSSTGLDSTKGSIRIGKTYNPSGSQNTTAGAIGTSNLTRFQVIRTGTGNIDLAAGRDIKLLNPFASIYTAGSKIANPNSIYSSDDFVTPVVVAENGNPSQTSQLGPVQQNYQPQWSMAGGNIFLNAAGTIGRYSVVNSVDTIDSSKQLPGNWLYRRGYVDETGKFGVGGVDAGDATITDASASTAWWIDFSNFFEGVGTLGGGNLRMNAGLDIINMDALIPTNARAAGLSGGNRVAPDPTKFLELGGGDLSVRAGRDLSGGVYYVERGSGEIFAAGSIVTNSSRSPKSNGDELTWLPTTLYAGKSSFDVSARKDILLGPVVNAFWLPQGLQNKFWYKTYFNTYSSDSSLNVQSLGGSITHRFTTFDSPAVSSDSETGISGQSILAFWLGNQNLFRSTNPSAAQPWIRLAEGNIGSMTVFSTVGGTLPPSLKSVSFGGSINITGEASLYPNAKGGLEILAAGAISGLNALGRNSAKTLTGFSSASLNLSDADPALLPSLFSPYSLQSIYGRNLAGLRSTPTNLLLDPVDNYFVETGSYAGVEAAVAKKKIRHAESILHSADSVPAYLYALGSDISGLTLYSAKQSRISASRDITDVALYLQNSRPSDISIISAGRDIIPYSESSLLRTTASDLNLGNVDLTVRGTTVTGKKISALAGDLQISGSGYLEVLAGRTLDLGNGENLADGRGAGITSIGNSRNPYLPFSGAQLVVMAGVGGKEDGPAIGLAGSSLAKNSFGPSAPSSEQDYLNQLPLFFTSLSEAAKEYTQTGSYSAGFEAITALFGSATQTGDIFTRSRDIRTTEGGGITLASPGGGLTMAASISGNPLTPPGIVTEYGGAVSVFTKNDVDIGQCRIFTLRGGDLTIWSSEGDIAAGSAAKTVVTAPPTRVLIDTTSADIQTDLGGLATGGGIGVLASVEGVEPGNVNLIAPGGTVDAGEAGIRSTGDIVIAAVSILNADNISAGGTTAGVPSTPTVAAPNIGGLTSGSSSTAAANSAANSVSNQARTPSQQVEETPSVITVEVLGYGGGDSDDHQSDEEQT